MGKVTDTIAAHRLAVGKDARMERSFINKHLSNSIFSKDNDNSKLESSTTYKLENDNIYESLRKQQVSPLSIHKPDLPSVRGDVSLKRPFAPAGQSTQMIIGATEETDLTLIKTSQLLYQNYDLKRVFYSAYIPLNEDSSLPALGTAPPLLREHRLYQADWLLRYYGFQAQELLSEDKPNFNDKIDPKCDWAIRHLGDFPVEVQTASFDMLLRTPGIGPKSAARIVNARRYSKLDYNSLKKMGVVLKRAHYFITCGGKMMYKIPLEENYITRQLVSLNNNENWQVIHQNESYVQMSLFDNFKLQA